MGGERKVRGFYFGDSGHGKQRLAMAAAAAMAMASRSSWGALLGQREGLPRVGAGRGRRGGAHLERNRTKIAWARRSTGRSVLGEKQRWRKLERGGRRAAWLGGSATLGWRWRAVWGAFYRRGEAVRGWRTRHSGVVTAQAGGERGQWCCAGVNGGGGGELACGWRGDATLRAGGDLRRRCCAEVAGAVRVWLGTAVRADGGVARLRSWRRGVHGSARRGAASVCTHACAGCIACARAWAVASCCCCAGGRGGRGALGAVAQGRARAEEKESRSGRAGKERGEGGEICAGSAVRGRPRAAPITRARPGACAGQGRTG